MISQSDLSPANSPDKSPAGTVQNLKFELSINPRLKEILQTIIRLQVTYVSELALELQESRDTAQAHVNQLMNMNLLRRLKVSDGFVPPLLERHLARYWARGITGLAMFQKRYWFTLALQDQGGPWSVEDMQEIMGA